VNVVAFVEATSIIEGRDVVEGFLACGIWLLSKKCEFEVDTKETPLSKVVVPMPKVTLTIGNKKSEAAFKAWIVVIANLLVDNYNVTEHNAYAGLQHGRLSHVFELVGMLYQPRLESIACGPRK
jgi:hypothetical protein